MARILCLFILVFYCLSHGTVARADRNNTLSAAIFVGDSYAPTNFRLSIKNFDIGVSDITNLYLGSRAWLNSYYAGFGIGIDPSIYGFVGYEWRFFSLGGMNFEFDGMMSLTGNAAGRFYMGFFIGV